jgi:integrase
MPTVRVKGVKRYRAKGRWYLYHRKTGTRFKAEFGTGEFFAELAALDSKVKQQQALPGTLGLLFACYRSSPRFTDLAPSTQHGYMRMMNLLQPLRDMPLTELTPQFIAALRDRIAAQHGRRQANYVMAVISVASEHGREHGAINENPVKGIKRMRRARDTPTANRPWLGEECREILAGVPAHLRVPIALGMFTGLRKGDVLALLKSSFRDGRLWRRTSKTGQLVSIPIHPDLAQILAEAGHHDAITIAVTSRGTPWTVSGFNSSFIKAVAALRQSGQVNAGLTFHGLRHTCGTLLIEAGFDIDTVRRWLGQKTLAMAIHYSETADTSTKMQDVLKKFDPLGSKTRTSSV